MNKDSRFKGIFPAFYACYEDGAISAKRTRALARHLVQKGVKGLYVGGSSGECIYQSPQERMQALEAVMDEVGGSCTVIAHVACTNTRDSQTLAAHAEGLGVDAIAAIPPIYFHLPAHAIAEYWNSISASAPKTPFFIYNIPQLAGTALTTDLLQTMLQNPRIAGVKNSSLAVQDIRAFKNIGGENFVVFNGPDEQYAAGRIMGADSGIGGTYAVMPELFLAVDRLLAAGNFAAAQQLQDAIRRIILVLDSGYSNLYAVMKEYLRRTYGLETGGVRAPLTDFVPDDEAIVRDAAERIEDAVHRFVR